ncbi:MAG TPA: adenylyl-sulfate kinase, partial [Polyangiaceae bacterium]|nr:adenylyl-sulfate kinase [Polyangiaceae bacterium]
VAIFAFASPRRFDRVAVRANVGDERFVQVYVATPLEECKRRDRRGAYGAGHVDPLYDVPVRVDVAVSLATDTPDQAARKIVAALEARGLFD